MVGAVPLADEGGDLLGREAVASPHRGSRLPAARPSTFETDGVFWDRPEGRFVVARALAGGYAMRVWCRSLAGCPASGRRCSPQRSVRQASRLDGGGRVYGTPPDQEPATKG